MNKLQDSRPLVVAVDDTITRKKGRNIPGVSWRRDPLGPPFSTNLVFARRFLQFSAVAPPENYCAPSRAIPIGLYHAPTAKKPSKHASDEAWAEYKIQKVTLGLGQQAVGRIIELREALDKEGESERELIVVVDGGYTNKTVIRNLPENTILVGRIRGDAKLNLPPPDKKRTSVGRRLSYGDVLPAPEDIRSSDDYEWKTAPVYAAGKVHQMRYKTVPVVLWRNTGANTLLRLVIIAPLSYRLSSKSRLLYRKPAYLICTGQGLAPEEILNDYVSRWDIEVNFRDEKQIIGFDEPQVRNEVSSSIAPAFGVASYSLLLLAAANVYGVNGLPDDLPPPKWRQKEQPPRATTTELIKTLRFQLWGQGLNNCNFSGFVDMTSCATNPEKYLPSLPDALFYAQPSG